MSTRRRNLNVCILFPRKAHQFCGSTLMINDIMLCTLLNGIEYLRRIAGDITVILWRRKAGQALALPGKNPAHPHINISTTKC